MHDKSSITLWWQIIASLAVLFFLAGCQSDEPSGEKQEVSREKISGEELEEAGEMIHQLYDIYNQLKEGIHSADIGHSRNISGELREILKNISMELSQRGVSEFDPLLKKLKVEAEEMQELEGEGDMAAAFSEFSTTLFQLIKLSASENSAGYHLMFCLKALDGKGGHWVTEDKKEDNPYLPDESDCKEVVETIE